MIEVLSPNKAQICRKRNTYDENGSGGQVALTQFLRFLSSLGLQSDELDVKFQSSLVFMLDSILRGSKMGNIST